MSHKLYFRFGTMSSSKTANLLMVAHNYKVQNKNVLLVKPCLDDRFGSDTIRSRAGIEQKADIVLTITSDLIKDYNIDYNKYCAVLVDEVQFLTEDQVEQLRIITQYVPVICYGLKNDYKTRLFPGSKRLIELADTIEEVKTVCTFCNKKATINMKFSNGKILKEGSDLIDLGTEDKYLSSCWFCWHTKIEI